jgi:hypothetical protein
MTTETEVPTTTPDKATVEQRRALMQEFGEIDNEFISFWLPTLKDICDYFMPQRGRFLVTPETEANKGIRKDVRIVNDTGVDSAKKLAAAMDTGITSAAREWLGLQPESPQAAEEQGQREHAHEVVQILLSAIGKSNFYKIVWNVYLDEVGPGTSLAICDEDDEEDFRWTHSPIGQYRLTVDARGRVNGAWRRFSMTAAQMIQEFGPQFCSGQVQEAVKNNRPQSRFQVLHVIKERTARQYGKIDAKNKPWGSWWMEWTTSSTGQSTGKEQTGSAALGFLRESGYDEKPFCAPRFETVGENVYGTGSPAWQSLGDCKALQDMEFGTAKTIARVTSPPMNAPNKLKNASILPNAINFLPDDASGKFEPAVMVPPLAVQVIREEKAVFENRIRRAHYAELLTMFSEDNHATPQTATEVRAKLDERLLQLGGFFSRFSDEFLKPAVMRMLSILERRGKLPPAPASMSKFRMDFQNIFVVAQKTLGISAVKELAQNIQMISTFKPTIVDKMDEDEFADTLADMLGVKPNLLHSDDEVKATRDARAKQEQAKAQGEAMAKAAPAVKQLSEANPDNLRELASQYGPAAAAAATGGGA